MTSGAHTLYCSLHFIYFPSRSTLRFPEASRLPPSPKQFYEMFKDLKNCQITALQNWNGNSWVGKDFAVTIHWVQVCMCLLIKGDLKSLLSCLKCAFGLIPRLLCWGREKPPHFRPHYAKFSNRHRSWNIIETTETNFSLNTLQQLERLKNVPLKM